MPILRTRSASSLASPPRPLSPAEIVEAQAILDRLRGEMLSALEKSGLSGRSALALSRDLDINRNISQRIAEWLNSGAGVGGEDDSLDALTKLPGAEGLGRFARALGARLEGKGRSGSGLKTPLLPAVVAYTCMVERVAGSRAELIRRVEATSRLRANVKASDNIDERRRFFEAAVTLHGCAVDVVLAINVVRPIPDSPRFVELINSFGLIGVQSLTAPVALASHLNHTREYAGQLAEEKKTVPLDPNAHDGSQMLRDFCSASLPPATQDERDGFTRYVVEPGSGGMEEHPGGVDFVRASKSWPAVHPADEADPNWYQSLATRRPSRRLVLDCYLHRSMAFACVPAVAPYYWHPGLTGNPRKHWYDRLPGRYALEMLGQGRAHSASAAWPRHAALTQRLFQLAGWNSDDFVGYRLDVIYPIWGAAHYMMFDFTSPQ